MKLPFTASEFFDVFARYNRAVPFAPIALSVVAIAIVVAIARGRPGRDRIAAKGLALLWAWSGLVYHWGFFAPVNSLAALFGVAFIGQAYWFFRGAGNIPSERIALGGTSGWRAVLGAIIVSYGLIGYPLAALAAGQVWPAMPTFGAPCPLVIFTLGVLLWSDASLPKHYLIMPLGWSVIGSVAAVAFNVYEDWGLLIAGALAGVGLLRRRPDVPDRFPLRNADASRAQAGRATAGHGR